MLITLIIKIRKKRIGYIGVGIGIGMFQRNFDIYLLNLISKYSDTFVSRSKNYLSFAPKLKDTQITLSSDVIFSDKIVSSSFNNDNSKTVVIALANIFKGNINEYNERFISELIIFIKHITSKGFNIKMISLTNEIDEEFNNLITKRVNSSSVISVPFCENPYDTFELIKNTYICVGMRFHSLVMALSLGIPCLSISYSDKNEDIMSRFDLSDYSLRFGISNKEYFNNEIMISSKQIIDKFEDVIAFYDILRDNIISKKRDLYSMSLINREEMRKLLKKGEK